MFSSELEFSGQSVDQEQLLMMTFLLKYEGGTQELYRIRLRIFYEWCQQNNLNLVHDIRRVHLELYAKYLKEARNNKAATVRQSICILKSFYEMLEVDDVIVKSPARNVTRPKIHQSDYKRPYLNRTQFTNLVEHARSKGPYDTCLVLMLGLMGLRASEVCSLNVSSVNHYESGHRLIRFSGKGSKPASLPMPILLLRELDDYLTTLPEGDGPLFRTLSDKRMDRGLLYRRIRTLTRNAPNVPEVGPHALRRSMITNSLNAGADIREVQKSARHSDLRTTSRVYDQGTPSYDSNSFNILAGYVAGAI